MPSPPSSSEGVRTITPTVGGSVDDIETFLNSGDEEPEVKDDKAKDDKEEVELVDDEEKEKIDLQDKKDKKDKSKEDEEESEEDKEDKVEDDEIEINAPPKKKELVAKYPNILKDFPFLEKMLYRDKQYQELFGSFDDAKEAAGKIEAFEHFETQLSIGNTEEVLKAIKDEDPKIFDKVVDNYLLTLHKVDKDAYFEVVTNIGKRFIMEMVTEANNTADEDSKMELKQAAVMLNRFLFGKDTYEPIKPRTNQEKENKDEQLEKEKLEFLQERHTTAVNDLQTKVDNVLRNTISEYIDPREVMSSYIKKNAVRDALANLNEMLAGDESLKRNLDRLWKVAADNKFDRDSLAKIQSAYLGRAKTLAPTAIKKARAEALKDITPSNKRERKEEVDEVEEQEDIPKKSHIPPGRPSSHKTANKMEKGESVLDFFSRD